MAKRSTSPVKKDKKTDALMRESYSATLDNVTADMTNEELRAMALKQHRTTGKPRGGEWSIALNTLIKQRQSLWGSNEKTEEKPTVSTEVVEKTEKPTTRHGDGGTIVNADGTINKNKTADQLGISVVELDERLNVNQSTDVKKEKHFGVHPEHDDPTWYSRSSTDPAETGKYGNVNLDKTINVKRSDLLNPEIMKTKNRERVAQGMDPILKKASRGYNMPGYGKRK